MPYLCPAGYPTVGYGHLIMDGEDFSKGLSQLEAEQLLAFDLKSDEATVLRLIEVPLTQGQFDALVSFTYNLGGGALQRSTLRRKINRGEHGDVPEELMRWVWAGGRQLKGLIRRRQAEGVMYQGG
jgi:lysozyme